MLNGVEIVTEHKAEDGGILLILVLQKLPCIDTSGLIHNNTAVVSADEGIDHGICVLIVPNSLLGLSCIQRFLLRPINNIPNSIEVEEDLDVIAEQTPVGAVEHSDTCRKWIVGGQHNEWQVEVKIKGK
jgi:hypothetical protein